ncbi:RNA-directed DNA polymerase, eukaryota [Artemisia annua]|uniref:RNA-directed DNA polymerase, eukaryota n=1 Tax=Artemisia annua TaxID=35608 RepID=A0A2U1L602_ARTAN|nr:RNA-directed DNA polymerase, eukaryota [Artemisia annua]
MKLNDFSIDNSFRRKARSGVEESQLGDLSEFISAATLTPIANSHVWSLENSGEFSVASIRMVIDGKRFPGVNSLTRWVKSVPIKVNIIAWKIKIDALLTRFNISRRGIEIDSIACPICNSGVDSTSHLFFQCSLANLKAVFEGVFYGLWWSIWIFRNKLLFDKEAPTQAMIFDNIVSISFYWCKFRSKASFKWNDWLKNPYLVVV